MCCVLDRWRAPTSCRSVWPMPCREGEKGAGYDGIHVTKSLLIMMMITILTVTIIMAVVVIVEWR
jgi:hypothetical protein